MAVRRCSFFLLDPQEAYELAGRFWIYRSTEVLTKSHPTFLLYEHRHRGPVRAPARILRLGRERLLNFPAFA